MVNDRTELAQYFNSLGFKKGAEIGVSCGLNAERLFRAIPDLTLYLVDPWAKYPGNKRSPCVERQLGHYEDAKRRLKNYHAIFMRMMSMEAVKQIKDNSLDFVFIDANHDYKYVLEDIVEWSKKVRSGGIVSGHDYYEFRGQGIIPAVTEYLKDKPKIKLNITPTHRPPKESHCFWWVKP